MKSATILRVTTVTTLLAATPAAHAHFLSGDGLVAGLAHPFLGFDHLLAMVAVGLWAAQLGERRLWTIPLAFVTGVLAGGVLGFVGLTVPGTESLVAASVLGFGLLVLLRARFAAAGLAITLCFAVWHGLAHATELTGTASALTYAAGFAVATAALHCAGIALGLMLRSHAAAVRLAGVPMALAGCWLLAGALS